MRPGTSFKPMLASPSKGVKEIHRNANGKVTLFSRNQIEQTAKYPDIVSRVPKCVKPGTNDFIIDGEVVAWDPGKQAILPFQQLRTRKRKISGEHAVQVQVVVFLFDIPYLNGQSLADRTFRERRKLLHDSFTEVPGKIYFAESLDTNNMDEIQKFLEKAIRGNCEGTCERDICGLIHQLKLSVLFIINNKYDKELKMMNKSSNVPHPQKSVRKCLTGQLLGLIVKTLDQKASYEIGKRSHNWLKLKKDYLEGIGDTLDLVVIGGYRGEGRRTGVYGAYLLASYDPKKKNYIAFSKVGTGFSDAELRKQYKDFGKIRIKEPLSNYVYNPASIPLHWFSPKVVWEIKSADFTISPVYPVCAGLVDKEKGLSLRAPRFIRVREDKSPEDATTPQQIYEMYQKQEQYRT